MLNQVVEMSEESVSLSEVATPRDSILTTPSTPTLEEYVEEYCLDTQGRLNTAASELHRFLNDPSKLAINHKIDARFEELRQERPFFSIPAAEPLIPRFINELPHSVRQEIFQEKLFEGPRGDRVKAALSDMYNIPADELDQVQLVDLKDYSTGRSFLHGHFVYQIRCSFADGAERTLFLKGISNLDLPELQKFPGWDNRPKLHEYDSFFQSILEQEGVSSYKSRSIGEYEDPSIRSLILAEEVKGQSTNLLFEDPESSLTKGISRGAESTAGRSFFSALANWHAISDLFGKADCRLQATPHLKRDANFLISQEPHGAVRLESIDHELLYCTPECKEYDRSKHYTEIAGLRLLARDRLEGDIDWYKQMYIEEATKLRKPENLGRLLKRTMHTFGVSSVEVSMLMQRALLDPREVISSQIQEEFGELYSTPPTPSETNPLERMADLLGVRIYNKAQVSGGALAWSQACDSHGVSDRMSKVAGRPFFDRFAAVEHLGLSPSKYIHEPVSSYLSKLASNEQGVFNNDEQVLAILESPAHTYRSIRVKLTHEELTVLMAALNAGAPTDDWRVTAVPLRQIRFQGNVTVREDQSVRGEFSRGTDQPSRDGIEQELCFETPRFLGVFPKLGCDDPEFSEIVAKILLALPKDDITGSRVPGYYEVAIGYSPGGNSPELFFQDYWEEF